MEICHYPANEELKKPYISSSSGSNPSTSVTVAKINHRFCRCIADHQMSNNREDDNHTDNQRAPVKAKYSLASDFREEIRENPEKDEAIGITVKNCIEEIPKSRLHILESCYLSITAIYDTGYLYQHSTCKSIPHHEQ